MVAAEDPMAALRAAPVRRPKNGLAESATTTPWTSGSPASGLRPSLITFMPRKMKPSPRIAIPTLRAAPRRAKKVTANPPPTSNRANSWTLKASSWTVTVVPMSAPRMTPRDCRKEIRPADTNPISIRVVAADDWTRAAVAAPAPTEARRLRVTLVSRRRRCPPAPRCRPSPMSCSP
jgi:hypothetical protein